MKLDDVAKIERGRFSPRPRNDPRYYGGDIPFVQTGDVSRAGMYIQEYSQTLNQEGLAVSKLFPKNTILMTIAANVGDVSILGFDSACPDSLVAFTPKEGIYNKWLFHVLSTMKRKFDSLSTQNAQKNLSLEKIKPVKIQVPSYDAQVDMASTFDEWDTAIEKTEALINAKEQQFEWLIKNLISSPKNLEHHKRITLSEIGEISSAGVDKKIVEGEEDVVLINYLDVYRRDKIFSYEITHKVTAPKLKVEKCSIKKGDILFTPSSEVRGDIGHSAVAMEDVIHGVYSYHIVRLRPKIELDLLYSAYAFKTHGFYKQVSKHAEGSGQRYVVSQNNFRKIEMFLPPFGEQKRIAKILDTARNEITLLKKLADKYRRQKRGLMQKLLSGNYKL